MQTTQSIKKAVLSDRKFGTFAGVFVPTTLTILGAIMYLRLGWVVGNAGLIGAVAIILLAHVITICTGLAVSSIATNIRVGAGGAFSIISQSLGLEVGGSISVPLYLAQAVSTTLYVFAFTEGWLSIFPSHNEIVVVLASLTAVFLIVYISARFVSRVQFFILAIVGISLFSIVMASVPSDVQPGMVLRPELWGTFSDGSFWYVFSVYFPAVTGIMAGISLSGDLKDPRRSIPLGTMSAIIVGMVIYLLLAFWLSRVATPDELVTNTTIMVERAYFSWAILAGLLGATFSSALGSMLAAPRVLQALGNHQAIPLSKMLGQETAAGEPRNALLATAVIVTITTLFAMVAGGLDAVAPLITMFFLITYLTLNLVVLIEQTMGMVSFRPTFAIPRVVPAVGVLGCLFVMFLVNPIFSLVAIAVTLGIYGFLGRRHLQAPWEDVRSGLFLSMANWAAEQMLKMPAAPERTWSPNVLAPVRSTQELTGSYRFLQALVAPQGSVHALGIYAAGKRQRVQDLETIVAAFHANGIWGRATLLESDSLIMGTRAAVEVLSGVFFRPNILFINGMPETAVGDSIPELVQRSRDYHMGVILLRQHPVLGLAQEKQINVWMREQGPEWRLGLRLANLDLAILLAYQLARNWHGRIRMCMSVPLEQADRAQQFLTELRELARLPEHTEVQVFAVPFWEALEAAPRADLHILGLQNIPDLDFVDKVVQTVDASCIFVRDSGEESALA